MISNSVLNPSALGSHSFMVPPCAVTILFVIASPRPLPSPLLDLSPVTKGSKMFSPASRDIPVPLSATMILTWPCLPYSASSSSVTPTAITVPKLLCLMELYKILSKARLI